LRLYHSIKIPTFAVLCLVFSIALYLRFYYVNQTVDDIYVARDAEHYVNYGKNLIHHRTFSYQGDKSPPIPDSFRSPGYPIFIALALKISGEYDYLKTALYSQAFLSAALVPLTFVIGTFFLSNPAAVLASGLVAINPHLITTSACVLTETLFSFLLLFAIYVFQLWQRNESFWLGGISAILFGFSFLTNETALFLPFIIVFVLALAKHFQIGNVSICKNSIALIVFLSIYSIFPVSWWLRGYYNVPVNAPKGSDRALVTMSHGAYPGFIYKDTRYKRFPYREDPQQPVFGSSLTNFSKILWSRVQNEPFKYVTWYLVGKPYYLWSWNIIQGAGDIYLNPVQSDLFVEQRSAAYVKKGMRILHFPLLISALLSIPFTLVIVRSTRNPVRYLGRVALVPMIVCVYFTIIYTIFAPWPRYSIPLRPELYLCAIWTLSIIVKYWRKHKVRS